MTDFYFIRHAEPRYDADDRTRGLSEKGLRDRALAAECLADKSVDVVLSSPYRRAVETVEVFAEERGMEVLPVEDSANSHGGSGKITTINWAAAKACARYSGGTSRR